MKINRIQKTALSVLVSWTLIIQTIPAAFSAEPSENFKNLKSLPEDTVGIVHLNNIPKVISDFKESLLYKAGIKFIETGTFKKIAEKNPEATTVKNMVLSILDSLPKAFTGEFTTAFLTYNEESKKPDFVILADSNEKEFDLLFEKILFPVIEKLNPPAPLIKEKGEKYSRIGEKDKKEGLFYSFSDGKIKMSPFPRVLDGFKKEKSLAENALFRATIAKLSGTPDAILYVNFINALKLANVSNENEFLRILGFNSVASIAASTKTVKNGSISELTLYAPEKISGILALLNRQASQPSIEKYVPQDYTFFIRFSVGDFGDFYKEIMALLKTELGEDDPVFQDMKQGIEDMETHLGMSLEKDILGSFGGQLGFALKVPKVLGIPEMAGFIEIKDKAKIEKIAEKISTDEMPFISSDYKEISLHSTTVKTFQSTYAFIDNLLVIGISPAVVKDIIDTKESGKSILTRPDYKNVFANLPQKGCLVAYHDTKETLNFVIPLLQENLLKARSEARDAKSLSNIKQLALGMKQFALDNDEKFPDKLSELYPSYVFSYDVFRHPSSGTAPIKKKEDIDKLADYKIFPKLTEFMPSDSILVYEKAGLSSRGGRNVGFIDGSARWMREEDFEKTINEQKKNLKTEIADEKDVKPQQIPESDTAKEVTLFILDSIKEMQGTGIVLTGDENSLSIKHFSGLGITGSMMPLIGAGITLPALQRAREQARRARSISNMKQIGLGMKLYALNNNEAYPDKFSLLVPDYISAPDIFRHPSSNTNKITKKEEIDEKSDYVLFPGLDETYPSDFIIIYEKDNISRGGRNVGYMDGSVRWMREDDFQKAITDQIIKIKNRESIKDEGKGE